jgi:uncharacterized protein (TIGR04551 family)
VPQAPASPAAAEEDEEEDDDDGGTAQLRAPRVEAPDVGPLGGRSDSLGARYDDASDDEGTDDAGAGATTARQPGDEALLEAESDEARLLRGPEAQSDPTAIADGWTAPQAVLTLHGYFRGRGDVQDTFNLGRPYSITGASSSAYLTPFDMWVPLERRATVAGGCGPSECDTDALANANMRLRMMPQLNLSDDVRVKMWIDVFDNLILGSTPDGGLGAGLSGAFAPIGPLTTTAVPPEASGRGLGDSIVARRAWAEVRNRTLGELRFGRMGWHWGLGMVAHAGDGLDDDYSTEVDRLLGITKIAGLYVIAAYDFVDSGVLARPGLYRGNQRTLLSVDYALPYDPAQRDDATQYMFAVARRLSAEEEAVALRRGRVVLNAGAFFLYRRQLLSSNALDDATGEPLLVRRRSDIYLPDLWAQFKFGSLRVEAEAAAVLGRVQNVLPGTPSESYRRDRLGLAQFGFTVDTELRLLDDKLGIYFNTGFGSGDSETASDGLGAFTDTVTRAPGRGGAISTFRFHPNYRVDLILWRQVLRQISGAYWFRPGISYDFIRGQFGQLFGGRVDLVWSRASQPVQTWGNAADLGVEIDASIYYRSEDGPEILDGFYAMAQFGMLFPMQGLGYLTYNGTPEVAGGNPELKNAQTFRLVLGVMF